MKCHNKTLFSDWILQWLKNEKAMVKESTYSLYALHIRKHILPLFKNMYMEELSIEILRGFISNLKEELSPKTIKDIFVLLQKICIDFDESIKVVFNEARFILPVDGEKVFDMLTDDEYHTLFNYLVANLAPKNIGILIAMMCGLRIGEVCALKWESISISNRLISINSTVYRRYDIKLESDKGHTVLNISSPKTKRSNRLVPIPRELATLLSAIKLRDDTQANNYLISSSQKIIEPRVFSSYYSNLLEKLSIRHHTFHALRHTFATKAALIGMNPEDLSRILGHSNINITLTRYYHPSPTDLVKAIDRVYYSAMN